MNPSSIRKRAYAPPHSGALLFGALLFGTLLGAGGCKDNARLADHEVRARDAQTITAYGQVLDQAASPKDVVYVFLKAVLDDYDAKDDQAKREQAFDLQLGTLATEKIKQEVGRRSQNEQQRLDSFFLAARRFAPVVGHYRETFREDHDALVGRMLASERGNNATSAAATVLVNLDHPDPNQRPQANVVARFDLVKEAGYWRIWWVSFDNNVRDWKQIEYQGRTLGDLSRSNQKDTPAQTP